MTNTNMEQQQSSYKEKERIDLREPRRFKVTIFNDDFTTMEFVVKILTTVFFKSTMEAEALMMQVHKSESAVIGIYTYDIARSKVQKATRMARAKTTAVRLIPAPGKTVGDEVSFGGLLGAAPIMPVHPESSADFIARGGRIPAPMQSLKN